MKHMTSEEKTDAIMALAPKSSVTFDGVIFSVERDGNDSVVAAYQETPGGGKGPMHSAGGAVVPHTRTEVGFLVEQAVPVYSVQVDRFIYGSREVDVLDEVGMAQLALALLDQAGFDRKEFLAAKEVIEGHTYPDGREPMSEEETWVLK